MVSMFLVTCFALINFIITNLGKQGYLLAGMSGFLLLLALFLAWEAAGILRQKHPETAAS
jgi:DMSO/TMAO reductase YedYZ heme-binding membrane subunit